MVFYIGLSLMLAELAKSACLGLSPVYGKPGPIEVSDIRQAKKLLDAKNENPKTPFVFAMKSAFVLDATGSSVDTSSLQIVLENWIQTVENWKELKRGAGP
jgi:hypothetical protein